MKRQKVVYSQRCHSGVGLYAPQKSGIAGINEQNNNKKVCHRITTFIYY